ncbi:hypothetical protein KRX57_08970 [Weeksellaceae bacterium TAE3-ERU29]|nr:hypothetical protein [Weeksellaceae bacterium TAE3-ERU29]
MEIKNKSLNRLLNEVIVLEFKDEIEKLGFKYLKTKNSFKLKKDDLILSIDFSLDYWDKYYINEEGEIVLNIIFTSSIDTIGFTKWYKKNYNESWGFGDVIDEIKFLHKLEDPDISKEDFSYLTPSIKFKNSVSELLHESIQENNVYKLVSNDKDEVLSFIRNSMIPDLIKNSNWDYIIKMIKSEKDFRVHYAYVFLLYYLNKIEESREAFEILLKNHYKKLENNEIQDIEDFKKYIVQRENEYKLMFNK